MRGGTDLQTYVDILVPSNAKLTLIKVRESTNLQKVAKLWTGGLNPILYLGGCFPNLTEVNLDNANNRIYRLTPILLAFFFLSNDASRLYAEKKTPICVR